MSEVKFFYGENIPWKCIRCGSSKNLTFCRLSTVKGNYRSG